MHSFADMLTATTARPVCVIALAVGCFLPFAGSAAHAQTDTYPQAGVIGGQAANSHASASTTAFFEAFFSEKSSKNVRQTMDYFSRDLVTYTDATLGWDLAGWEELRAIFERYMPGWGSGRSYATRVLGQFDRNGSALVAFTDTPELFGGELRILAAVDVRDGKVVRWVDYWDSTTFDENLYRQLRTVEAEFPRDYKEQLIGVVADPVLVRTSNELSEAWSKGDVEAASRLFSYDVVFEDMSLRRQVLGVLEVQAYLAEVMSVAPYGEGSQLRHVVGSSRGGGFEWIGEDGTGRLSGITALELDVDGRISRITTVYDSRALPAERRSQLSLADDGR